MRPVPDILTIETDLLPVEKESKPVYREWWFWVLLVACVVLSFSSGALAGGAHIVEETPLPGPRGSMQAAPGDLEAATPATENAYHHEEIRKLLRTGVIERIHEPNRLLYVNDAVWKVINADQKERTVRIVVAYLDWIHATRAGSVEVLSHRTGRPVRMN